MLSVNSRALVLLPLCLTTAVRGLEIIYGHNAITRTRLDPIVNPGAIAGHVHVFSGTNAITSKMTAESAVAAGCTTSSFSDDKSGYWMPQLYYKWRNGTYSAISGDGIVTYWMLDRGRMRENGIRPVVVPDDFRIVAGDPKRDFLDARIPSHNAVSFQCFGTRNGEHYDYRLNTLPVDFECENIRPQVFFPSCWNGRDSYLPDNSHVTYPVGAPGDYENGVCPDGFTKIPGLFMETYYTNLKKLVPDYEWYPGSLVFSNGDNYGLSFHADWQNGLPSGLLVDVFDQCPTLYGSARACPILAKSMGAVSEPECPLVGEIVNEPIGLDFPLAKLPGNNPEYNSSKAGNNPKRPDPNYVETSSIIKFDPATGGSCQRQKCTDYTGPRNAPPAGAPVVVPALATKPASTPVPIAPAVPVSTVTPGGAPVPVDGSPIAEPSKPANPTPANPSPPLVDDGEMVCARRKKKQRLSAAY